ncbi:hypothetical protein ACU82A_20380 [Bacillus cereus]
MTTFERENLSFSVIKGQDRNAYLADYIRQNQKGIWDYICSY